MLRKALTSEYTSISTIFFPYRTISKGKKRVTLGIGGNIGDVIRRFRHLFCYLRRSPLVHVIESSPILKNPPFGFLEQSDFYNAVVVIETELNPQRLLRYLLEIERKFGRRRLFQDAPRTLDIDILFYENRVINTPKLTLPHPKWLERDSVVIPLSQLKGSSKSKK